MDDLKIYLSSEDDRDKVQRFLEESFPGSDLALWEPDGDSEGDGTWGMFVDNIVDTAWDSLILEFGDEQGLNGHFELYRGDTDQEFSSVSA